MLGLGRHASISEFRYAYEQAMADAVRRGDFAHARELSTAYDQLSPTRRDQVYGRSQGSWTRPAAPASGTRARGATRGLTSTSLKRSRRVSPLAKRISLYVATIPTLVVVGAIVVARNNPNNHAASAPLPPQQNTPNTRTHASAPVAAPPIAETSPIRPLPTQSATRAAIRAPAIPTGVQPVSTYTPGSTYAAGSHPPYGRRYIPLTTPVMVNGMVLMFCPPGPVRAQAYTIPEPPGSIVGCSNGAAPMVVKNNAIP